MRGFVSALAALTAASCLVACNAGLGGLVAASSDDETASNSPSTVTAFAVEDPEESPARIRFQVVDPEGDSTELEFFYQLPGSDPEILTRLTGTENPSRFAGSASGLEHELEWDFTGETSLPSTGSYTPGVLVWARRQGVSVITPGANANIGGLGNDPPEVDSIEVPRDEGSGITLVRVTLSDTSADILDLKIEYEVAGTDVWSPVRPAGESDSPEYAIVGLSAPPEGVTINFFWDTQADLPFQERDVRLRFTPEDPTVPGGTLMSDVFAIDNNDEATVLLDNGLVALEATDELGGIAIPFSVADEESDDLRVVFQWRRPGEDFPTLPDDPAQVFAIQEDPDLRAQYQVCSERVSYIQGRAQAGDDFHLRLPELGTSAVPIATPLLANRDLELLRPIAMPVELTAAWSEGSLSSPVAVLPVGDGIEGLVLDAPGAGSWRLRRLVLGTGEVLQDQVASTGAPTAMALSPAGTSAVVASLNGSDWRLDRLAVEDGGFLGSISGTTTSPEGVRGLAMISEQVAVVSVDDSLLELNFATGKSRVVTSGLDTPWGVAADPSKWNTVLVAESGADRLLVVDVRKSSVRPLDLSGVDGPALLAPRGLALARGGSRLLTTIDAGGSGRELVALDRFSPHDLDGDLQADRFFFSMAELSGPGSHIGTGPENLRVVPDPDSGSILALGGVEQRRRIAEATASSNVVTLESALAPPLTGPRDWRVRRSPERFTSSPGLTSHNFPWDSRDVSGGGGVLFRALPYDSELGLVSETAVERAIVPEFGHRRTPLAPGVHEVVAHPIPVDYEGDGDWDVFVGEGANSRFLVQERPGVFAAAPVPLGLPLTNSLEVPEILEDLDGDGHLDLVHYRDDLVVEVFRGTGVGSFAPVPQSLSIPGPQPISGFRQETMITGDVDGDGLLDLLVTKASWDVSATDELFNAILIYLQEPGGAFAETPIVVGGDGVTDLPSCLSLGDVDGNGLVDVASGNFGYRDNDIGFHHSTGHISIHYQTAPGVFDPSPRIIGEYDAVNLNYSTSVTGSLALADMDEDGDLDLVAAHGRSSSSFSGQQFPRHFDEITIFWQLPAGDFDPEPMILESPPTEFSVIQGYNGLALADFNGDGHLDLAGHNRVGMLLFQSRGPGVFDAEPIFLHAGEGQAPTAGFYVRNAQPMSPVDLEGDGDLDLLFLDLQTFSVEVARGQGAGVEGFGATPFQVDPVGGGMFDCLAADLDGDGDLDLAGAANGILGNAASSRIEIIHQNSPRSFASTPQGVGGLPGTQYPTRFDAADMDQDGDRDLVVVSTTTNELQIFLQESTGTFGLPATFEGAETGINPLFNALMSLRVADLDGDGDLDVLSAPNENETFFGFEQYEAGLFRQAFRIDNFEKGMPVNLFPMDLASADLDGDGDQELLATSGTNANQSHVLIFDGSGPLQHDPTPTQLDGAGSNQLEVVDVDGDGDLDLVTTGEILGGAAVRLFLNLRNDEGGYDQVELNHAVSPLPISTAAIGKNWRLVDHDRDGDLDIFANLGGFLFFPGNLSVIEQLAPGVFAAEPTIVVPSAVAPGFSLHVEDIDADGELDVLQSTFVAGVGNGLLTVLWGNR